MKNDNQKFVTWALGILSGGLLLMFAGLGRMVIQHETEIAVLKATRCPPDRSISLLREEPQTIWSSVSFGIPQLLDLIENEKKGP